MFNATVTPVILSLAAARSDTMCELHITVDGEQQIITGREISVDRYTFVTVDEAGNTASSPIPR